MKYFRVCILFVLILSQSLLSAEWFHLKVQSQDKHHIYIDFQVDQKFIQTAEGTTDRLLVANEAYINFYPHRDFANGKDVRIVFINYPLDSYTSIGWPPVVREYGNLPWTGDHFWTQILGGTVVQRPMLEYLVDNIVIFKEGLGGGQLFRQEIAIFYDGKWLIDPISKDHNFKINMYEKYMQ